MTKYTRANAEALLSVVTAQPDCHWLPIPSEPDSRSPSPIYINDEGIFPNVTAEAELRWKPCHELPDGPDAQDRAAQPGLPFPFTENELAAWMLNGVGALVASAFGNLVEREPAENEPTDQPTRLGPDFSVLTDPDANKAREAIQAAFDIYRETVAHRKPEPKRSPKEDVISRDEMRNEALVNHGLKTPQGAVTQGLGYRAAAEKIRLVRADVREAYQTAMVRRAVRGPDAHHAEWLSGMTQRLLKPVVISAETQPAYAVDDLSQDETGFTGVVGHTKGYILEVMRTARWSSVKELFRELVRRADQPGSPFLKGTGHALGKLYVPDLNKTLAEATLSNAMPRLRSELK